MASPAAFEPIEDYLRGEWTETQLVFENEGFPVPDEPAPFVFVEVFGSFYDQASLGAETIDGNLWREEGQISAHVLTPRGTGTRDARRLAKMLVDLFRGTELAGIRFQEASIGASGPGDEDGNYYRTTATIAWERDE